MKEKTHNDDVYRNRALVLEALRFSASKGHKDQTEMILLMIKLRKEFEHEKQKQSG